MTAKETRAGDGAPAPTDAVAEAFRAIGRHMARDHWLPDAEYRRLRDMIDLGEQAHYAMVAELEGYRAEAARQQAEPYRSDRDLATARVRYPDGDTDPPLLRESQGPSSYVFGGGTAEEC